MKRALFKSFNLIGDGLNIRPALSAWHRENPEYEIELWTLNDHIAELYKGFKLPIRVIFEPDCDYDFRFDFDVSAAFAIGEKYKKHIAECYSIMLRVRLIQDDWKVVYDPGNLEHDDPRLCPMWNDWCHCLDLGYTNRILISPFSRSCASNEGKPPNKMISELHWKFIIDYARTQGQIGILGGKGDRFKRLDIAEEEYLTGLPFPTVAAIMKRAKVLITIDNGIAHLAGTQDIRTVLFYPAVLGTHWIMPINKNLLKVLQMDPAEVHPEALFLQVKKVFKDKL